MSCVGPSTSGVSHQHRPHFHHRFRHHRKARSSRNRTGQRMNFTAASQPPSSKSACYGVGSSCYTRDTPRCFLRNQLIPRSCLFVPGALYFHPRRFYFGTHVPYLPQIFMYRLNFFSENTKAIPIFLLSAFRARNCILIG